MPELRHLRTFVVVADRLSFTRAADALGQRQQSVSKTVRELERELGVVLLERTTHEVRLTAAGAALRADAAEVLRRAQAAFDRAREVGLGLQGVVRIGVTPAVGPVDREAIVRVLRSSAEVSVALREIRPAELRPLLRERHLELAVTVASGVDDPGLHKAPLRPAQLMIAVRADHRLAGRSAVTPADLDGERLILPSPRGTPFTDLIVDRVTAAGATVQTLEARVTGGATLVTELEHVDGVAVVPAGSHSPAAVSFAEVTGLTVPLWLLWPAGARSTAVDRVLAELGAPG